MRIDYLAHACFLVTGDSGVRIAFDPYDPKHYGAAFRFKPAGADADLVFASHDHADHGAVGEIGGSPRVVKGAVSGSHRGVEWSGLGAFHDEAHGAQRGPVTVFRLTVEGIALCHLGDLGAPLAAAEAAKLGKPDVLFVPVGGHFTIDAAGAVAVGRLLKPRVVVPMHFRTTKLDFPIAPPEDFLDISPWPVSRKGGTVTFKTAELPSTTEVWFMEPLR
ncbi:MAG TPA: MBL fold metallo-hydrolase [Planctomycetota bacterium]|nr:MBL fold metallo-hydrolase [Planctomycetota bacterium]